MCSKSEQDGIADGFPGKIDPVTGLPPTGILKKLPGKWKSCFRSHGNGNSL